MTDISSISAAVPPPVQTTAAPSPPSPPAPSAATAVAAAPVIPSPTYTAMAETAASIIRGVSVNQSA